MGNPQKEKGTRWERDAVKLLNKAFPGAWKRIVMSGAIGTQLGMPILKPDAIGDYKHIPRKLVGECKVGYGGKSMTIQKEWFDGISEIADENFALPVVILKFEKSWTGVKHIMCMDFETWDELMRYMAEMYHELINAYEALENYDKESIHRDAISGVGKVTE